MKIFNQMVKFYLVGSSGVLVNLSLLYLFTEFLGFWYVFSAFIAILASITTNFLGNKFWTFKSLEKNFRAIFSQYLKFLSSSLIGISIQISLIYIFVQFFGFWYILAAIVAIATASFSNFLLSKYWAFRK